MQNASVILTKNSVLNKIKGGLEELQQLQVDTLDESGDALIFSVPPKISKGENYRGLPFLILDHPRYSSGPDLFFIRHMFWWGNFFSSTLHLAGEYCDRFRENIIDAYPLLTHYSVGINTDPWEHHFEDSNYKPVSSLSKAAFTEACHRNQHLKIARRFPLGDWEFMGREMYESWKFLLGICHQLPRR